MRVEVRYGGGWRGGGNWGEVGRRVRWWVGWGLG